MPVQPTYPGVYIEEIPSGVRTITGVSTSVAAFIGQFRRGPMDQPVQLFNLGDFERELGGLLATSEASYAIQQFFLNGGSEAWAVRVAGGTPAKASVEIKAEDGSTALTIEAVSAGAWGNDLQVSIDHKTEKPTTLFNLTVSEVGTGGRTEVFRNLAMVDGPRFVKTVVNAGSKLVRVSATSGTELPAQNGTVSGLLPSVSVSNTSPAVDVTIGAEGTYTASLGGTLTTLAGARSSLESAIRASRPSSPAFSEVTVEVVNDRLRILTGPASSATQIAFAPGGADPTWKKLGLDAASKFKAFVSKDLGSFSGLSEAAPAVEIHFADSTVAAVPLSAPYTTLAETRASLQKAIRLANTKLKDSLAVTFQEASKVYLVLLVPTDVLLLAAPGGDSTLTELGLDAPTEQVGIVSSNVHGFPGLLPTEGSLKIKIGSADPIPVTLTTHPQALLLAPAALESALIATSNPALVKTKVALYSDGADDRFVVLLDALTATISFSAAPADSTTVEELRLDSSHGATVNVQQYALGVGSPILGTKQGGGVLGSEGALPDANALIGKADLKTGIYALENIDLFNILCIPRTALVPAGLDPNSAKAVMTVAIAYCAQRRAMFLIDTPSGVADVQAIKEWLAGAALPPSKNAALYFPRVQIADPLNEFRLRSVGASGTIAGLYARTDASRGVWKAPAGTEATLTNVQALDAKLSDAENGALNPLAINTLRNFPVYGNVCWGARTMEGADQKASEWKYIPVRRLALFLEESLYRGTQWVVFEPNDEPLWAQIRLNIGAFLHTLFRQGAFQGKTPRDAYLVKCDKETTTQDDINRGVVNILVGFAPLKPAEFVILQIQQLAGQIQT